VAFSFCFIFFFLAGADLGDVKVGGQPVESAVEFVDAFSVGPDAELLGLLLLAPPLHLLEAPLGGGLGLLEPRQLGRLLVAVFLVVVVVVAALPTLQLSLLPVVVLLLLRPALILLLLALLLGRVRRLLLPLAALRPAGKVGASSIIIY
jgi:hypothetical protein